MREGMKNKTISFNMNDPIEKAMYDFSVKMKKNKHSFGGLIKNLLLLYMSNIGEPPPGMSGNIVNKNPYLEKPTGKKIVKAPFTLDD